MIACAASAFDSVVTALQAVRARAGSYNTRCLAMKLGFSAPMGGGTGSSSGSWGRRPRSLGPSGSTAVGSSCKEEIVLSSGDEDQPQQRPRLLSEAALMDEESVRQMEIMMECSLRQMGPTPPSPVRVKEEPPSPPCYCIKREPASPLRQVKDEPPQREKLWRCPDWTPCQGRARVAIGTQPVHAH